MNFKTGNWEFKLIWGNSFTLISLIHFFTKLRFQNIYFDGWNIFIQAVYSGLNNQK